MPTSTAKRAPSSKKKQPAKSKIVVTSNSPGPIVGKPGTIQEEILQQTQRNYQMLSQISYTQYEGMVIQREEIDKLEADKENLKTVILIVGFFAIFAILKMLKLASDLDAVEQRYYYHIAE